MSTRALAAAIVLATLAACGRDARPAADSTGAAGTLEGPRAPGPVTRLDSAYEACGIVKTPAHDDAAALLREWVQREAAGEFVRRGPWLDGAVDCPRGELEAGDQFAVVADYAVDSVAVHDSVAVARFHARRIGVVSGAGTNHASFDAAPGTVADSVRAHRTPWGWRVTTPAPRGMVLYSAFPVRETLGAGYGIVEQMGRAGRRK